MSSNTITLIFCLGGLTFLANWICLIYFYFKNNSVTLNGKIEVLKTFFYMLLFSTIGVLAMGVLFVSALMFSHG
tara:strand:- start:469 stop:690 length:222 start_codon:yes stop_codon:yes gene_type:complete